MVSRILLLASLLTLPALAQNTPRPTSTPYAGDLSIFEYPDRDQKLEIQRVMTLLDLKPGKNVADIGAGSGWFTVRAARRVAPAGTVYAEDINPEAISTSSSEPPRNPCPTSSLSSEPRKTQDFHPAASTPYSS